MLNARHDGPGSERDQARFYAKVALPNEQGCMLWLGGLNWRGYGRFSLRGRDYKPHRFAYELWVGPIPSGMQVDHVKAKGCTNRHCVAPDHLEAVTQAENLYRGDTLAAANKAKTHCRNGHPYAGDNLYVTPAGHRRCRTCQRAQNRKRRQRATC